MWQSCYSKWKPITLGIFSGHHAKKATTTMASSNNENEELAGMILAGSLDRASLLESAFQSLDESDQYDAVLTGLCAKILDAPSSSSKTTSEGEGESDVVEKSDAFKKMADPIQLLGEMNGRKVKASGRSIMALIDATATTQDPGVMSTILSLSISNGALRNYGSLQATVTPIPSSPQAPISGFAERKTRMQRLEALPPVPVDDRAAEVSSALTFSSVVAACLLYNTASPIFGADDFVTYTNLLLGTMTTVVVLDNFYDAIRTGASFVAKSNEEKIPDSMKKMSMPEKESLPAGLGTGQLTGTVVRGLSRLLSVDTERECECEAAAFFAAYSLGLPCFAFRPNALEAAVLIFESMKESGGTTVPGIKKGVNALNPLLSSEGILKVLIWLMAPVAMECSKHPQLISSDPREGVGLLRRLSEKAESMGAVEVIDTLLRGEDDSIDEAGDLLQWAYAEADLLLRNNRKVVEELTERLAGGAATVGDCVAVLEDW